MIVYLDSSVLVRAYLSDEEGHAEAASLLSDPEIAPVTAALTRIEASGALVRAASAGRSKEKDLLELFDADLGDRGNVLVLRPDQAEVEAVALDLVREHPLRALDAWHLAVARIAVPPLARPRERIAFATRDATQGTVAERLGFELA